MLSLYKNMNVYRLRWNTMTVYNVAKLYAMLYRVRKLHVTSDRER